MLVDRKPLIYLWRPIYRLVFVGVLWPLLGRVGKVMISEVKAELTSMEHRLASIEQEQQRFRAQLEADNRAQWQSIEELLLCLLRDPGVTVWKSDPPQQQVVSKPH